MTLWIIIILAGIITYAMRLSFIVLADRLRLSAKFRMTLELVPIAALTAIIVPGLIVTANGTVTPLNARAIAGAGAVLIAWRTKNTLLTIAAGMIILWGSYFIFGIPD